MLALLLGLLAQIFLDGKPLVGAQAFILTSPTAVATPTATATPTSTATPVPVQGFVIIFDPTGGLIVGNTLVLQFQVTTPVAYVDVKDNGTLVPNMQDPKNPHSVVFRLGGQPVPGMGTGGVLRWTVNPPTGPHNLVYIAYDDGGNLMQTVVKGPYMVQ